MVIYFRRGIALVPMGGAIDDKYCSLFQTRYSPGPYGRSYLSLYMVIYFRRGIALAPMGGAIYAVGGLDDSTCYDTVERYDHACDKWTFVSSMNVRRGGVGVTALNVKLLIDIQDIKLGDILAFNTTLNNISAISWLVLLMEETGVPRENH